MVEYHRTLLALIRPGVLPVDILRRLPRRCAASRPDFPESAYREGALESLAFAGHLSHPVGMAVHDVGDYSNAPLEPGMVFAVDPMMWVREHQTYVRCEDTVVVTENGLENLTCQAPLSVEEIEEAMTEQSPLLPVLAVRPWWGTVEQGAAGNAGSPPDQPSI